MFDKLQERKLKTTTKREVFYVDQAIDSNWVTYISENDFGSRERPTQRISPKFIIHCFLSETEIQLQFTNRAEFCLHLLCLTKISTIDSTTALVHNS